MKNKVIVAVNIFSTELSMFQQFLDMKMWLIGHRQLLYLFNWVAEADSTHWSPQNVGVYAGMGWWS